MRSIHRFSARVVIVLGWGTSERWEIAHGIGKQPHFFSVWKWKFSEVSCAGSTTRDGREAALNNSQTTNLNNTQASFLRRNLLAHLNDYLDQGCHMIMISLNYSRYVRRTSEISIRTGWRNTLGKKSNKIAVKYWFCCLSALQKGRHVVKLYKSRRVMLDILVYRGSGQASLNSNGSKFCLLLNGNTDTPWGGSRTGHLSLTCECRAVPMAFIANLSR